jgi:hypothetical protein
MPGARQGLSVKGTGHEPVREYQQTQKGRHQPIEEEVHDQRQGIRQHEGRLSKEEEVGHGPQKRLMMYSAYCMADADGKFGLCVMLEGFDTPEAAQWFLQQLMGPFEGYEEATSETVH